jgi:AMP deaminase
MARSGSNRWVRPKSPKSTVTSTSAFGSTDVSDEDDDTQNGGKLENRCMNTNGKIVSSCYPLGMHYYFF